MPLGYELDLHRPSRHSRVAPMKVLVAHAPRLLIDEMLRRGHELVVAHEPHAGPASATDHRFVPLRRLPKLDPRTVLAMRQIVATHRPDLIHAFSPRSLAAAVLGTMGMRGRPDIVSFRGIASVPKRVDVGNFVTFLSPRVAAHTCESHAVADGLVAAGIAPEACHVIYNCVDARALEIQERGVIRGRIGVPADAFVVGTIASVRPVKGIDILLRAALECLDLPDLVVVVFGQLRDGLVSRLAEDPRWKDRLRMTGHVPMAGGMAGAFDVFVMPSRSEGLCRALLEAATLGVCPVVSDAGGMKEVVRHGREGLVFPRENVSALTAAIRHLHAHRHLLREYGEAARRRVGEMCSPAAMADRIESCYHAVSGRLAAPLTPPVGSRQAD
jgi:glycosyltransferase involved in cell wall biosynthesis